jgi:hypothetical protein
MSNRDVPRFRRFGRTILCTALLVLGGIQALAAQDTVLASQPPVDPSKLAMAKYYKCSLDYANRLASSKESAGDIADSAVVAGRNARVGQVLSFPAPMARLPGYE